MERKKILIVSRSYHPIIAPRSFRATQLAEEYSRQGHSVTVLTHKRENFDYEKYSREKNIKIEDFVRTKWKDINSSNIFFKAIRKILNVLFLFPEIQIVPLLKKYLANKKGYDLLISIAVPYPVHWGVALAKENNPELTNTWVADCGDPFMGNKEKKIPHPFYFHFVERWFCKKPDYITVPIKNAVKAYPNLCKDKIKVIPQGFKFDCIYTSNDSKKNKKEVLFAYAGSLTAGTRDPKLFLEYLSQITEIDFKFFVYTKKTSLLLPYEKKLSDKLIIKNYIPRENLMKELGKMDFLVNIENVNNVQSPSKLIDYSLTGRPILTVNPNNIDKDTIDEFLDGNYQNKFIVDDLKQYDIQHVADKFIELINEN